MEVLKIPTQDLRRAVVLAALAEGLLTFMDACIKSLTPRYPTFEIAFMRFAMGSVFAILAFALQRPQWPTREAIRFNALRSILIVVTAVAFFYALSKLPMAEAMALSFVSPLFMALFGVLLLKERFNSRIGAALLAGLVGMAIIVGGRIGTENYSNDAMLGAAAVLLSAVTYAIVIVLLRARSKVDPLPTIVLFQNIGPALRLAIPAATVWTTPNVRDLALFAGIGMLGVFGHTLMTHAFARAEAASLAPVHYIVLVWGTLFGIMFFGEYPGVPTIIGAGLILVATLITQRR